MRVLPGLARLQGSLGTGNSGLRRGRARQLLEHAVLGKGAWSACSSSAPDHPPISLQAFHLPREAAAEALGVTVNELKKALRNQKIERWCVASRACVLCCLWREGRP